MAQIFISYSSSDADFAHRLADAFGEEGWSVWWDRQIPPGMDYARVIEAAIDEARCIVVLWSEQSIQSRWVATEAAAAADRDIIITTIIDDTPNEALPFEFRRLQAVRLSDWRGGQAHEGYTRVAARIRSILGDTDSSGVVAVSPSPALAGWGETLTRWGSGAQPLWRAAAVVAGLAALGLLSFGIVPAQPGMLAGAAALAVIGALLMHRGRRAF
jgi:hypothetical protein